jgi:hypothetical protein
MSIAASAASLGELQRDYLFQVTFMNLPEGFKSEYESVKGDLDLYMTKGVFPSRKTAEIAVKWGGETIYYSGVDESQKTGDLVFRLPQDMRARNFLENLKDLTGDLAAHAAALKQNQTIDIVVSLISVDKQTVTDSRKLENVLFYSVEDINLDKEGSGISTFKVHISWDRSSKVVGVAKLDEPDLGASEEDKLSYVTTNPESGGGSGGESGGESGGGSGGA